MKLLSQEKRDALVQGVYTRMRSAWEKEWAELRAHEVSSQDAAGIMARAHSEVGIIQFTDLEAVAPAVPRPFGK